MADGDRSEEGLPPLEDPLDLRDAAKKLGVSTRRLEQMKRAGEIAYIDHGGKHVYEPSEIRRILDERRRKAGMPYRTRIAHPDALLGSMGLVPQE